MLFDQRVRTLHDFGASPHNFISFNPQGRLMALAGFGNLAGKIEIIDRRTFAKVCTIDAPNTSHCEWSPDGRSLLTATLSPRLRVDNGIKIWHCSGPLVHVQLTEELYAAQWRPTPVENVQPFGHTIPPAPAPSESVKALAAIAKPVPTKPAGAYRPPGARGLATPSIFKREDEGGPTMNGTGSGSATPPRFNRSPVPGAPGYNQQNGNGHPNGHYQNQNGGRRNVPGAPPAPNTGSADNQQQKGNRKRKGKKEGGQTTPGAGEEDGADGRQSFDQPAAGNGQHGQHPGGRSNGHQGQRQDGRGNNGNRNNNEKRVNGAGGIVNLPPPVVVHPPAAAEETPVTPGADSALDPVAKKVRNLNKKLKAIEELKEKAKRGERLEATQLRKMEGEAEIRKELAALGA